MRPVQPDAAPRGQPAAAWRGRITRCEVSVDALAHNVATLAAHVAPAELIAVVKADAYGHGAEVVAEVALRHGARRLAVYTVDEAVVLREAGITAPILVFGPLGSGEAPSVVRHHLTPTITTVKVGQALQDAAGARTVPYHLKVDTGLARAGVSVGDVRDLVAALAQFPALRAEGLYTHFARADEGHESVGKQLRALLQVREALRADNVPISLVHAANSAAALWRRDSHLSGVRVGISLYGYAPGSALSTELPLRPALTLLSGVTRLHQLSVGAGVGYGHTFIAQRPTVIALVPIGYGDGLPRVLGSGRGNVLVRERLAPIVGRVSMDQVTVDVTDIPGVQNGDVVTLIGRQAAAAITADDQAAAAGTISYEILTGIMPRVPRLYVRGGVIERVKLLGRLDPPL